MAEKANPRSEKFLNEDFIIELFALAIKTPQDLEIINKHLKYQFLPTEAHKLVWKHITDIYLITEKTPTWGTLAQAIQADPEDSSDTAMEIVKASKAATILGKSDQILSRFESFIKGETMKEGLKDIAKMYSEGKHDQAINKLQEVNDLVSNISINDDDIVNIVSDIEARVEKRLVFKDTASVTIAASRIPFGIPDLDRNLRGGLQLGDSMLIAARSGTGKSTMLRHWCIEGAKAGFEMFYGALEDSLRNIIDYFDSNLTGIAFSLLQDGLYTEEEFMAIKEGFSGWGDIKVKKYKSFESIYVSEVRKDIIELSRDKRIQGVALDYIDLSTIPGKDDSRIKKVKTTQQFVKMNSELDIAGLTATQVNDVKDTDYNNASFVLKRTNISEAKNAIDAFPHFLSINQTETEKDNQTIRLYQDKKRNGGAGGEVFTFAQDLDTYQFYSRAKTKKLFS